MVALAASPAVPGLVHGTFELVSLRGLMGLAASRDWGRTWQPVPGGPAPDYAIALAASPHDPTLLFAVTEEGWLWAYREASPALPGRGRTAPSPVNRAG